METREEGAATKLVMCEALDQLKKSAANEAEWRRLCCAKYEMPWKDLKRMQ